MNLPFCLLCIVLVLLAPSTAFACTSFALYGNEIFYGMNFDYFTIPLKFIMESRQGMTLFHLTFLFDQTIEDPQYRDYFAKTCGMNSQGLFCASQEIEPFVEGQKHPGKGQSHIDDHYEAIGRCARVSQVKKGLPDNQWIQFIGPSIHHLFADVTGQAMVTETDNSENFITDIEGDFMVMTNFANHSLRGKSCKAARGAGAERFCIAHEFLFENCRSFSLEKGFSLLKKARCKDKDFKTLCSLICRPETRSVYIALNLDMDRIWKIDLSSKTLETYKGYRRYQKTSLDEKGLLSSDLEKFGR